MKPLKKLLNNLTTKNNKSKNSNKNKNNKKINIKIINKNKNRKGNGKPKNRKIAAANIRNMNRDFKILYQDGTTVKVTGRDLVYKIPSTITSTINNQTITIIPANPCYWLGTRIAALAQGYQNYRPLNMKFTYIPQVAVTQQGNVICGTLWNQAPSNENIQQSLRTSNGGMLSQCYKSFTSIVRMKSNLQFNLYKTAGTFDQESNPFIFMALGVGTTDSEGDQIIPGYFYVTWSFLLKNPIGNTNIYYNSGITRWNQIKEKNDENRTIVFLTEGDDEIPQGAILQIDTDENNENYVTYNGSHYDMSEDDVVWYFANSSIQQVQALTKTNQEPLYYQQVTTPEQTGETFHSQVYFRTSTNEPEYYYLSYYPKRVTITIQEGRIYYFIEDRLQDIIDQIRFMAGGILQGYQYIEDYDGVGFQFKVPKSQVYLVHLGDRQNNNIKNQPRNKALQTKENKIVSQQDQQDKVLHKNKSQPKMIKQSSSKYFTNISPIFESS